MKHIAAIDVGSNAVRLAIGEIKSDGRLESKKNIRAPVRLGRDVFDTGEVQEKAQKKLLKALYKFEKFLKKYNVRYVRAVATSAMREAKNSRDILKKVEEKIGIRLSVISGEEEAKLINRAVLEAVDLRDRFAALIDIGGGSLEISFLKNQSLTQTQTFPLGTVRVMSKAGLKPEQTDISKMDAVIKAHEKSVADYCAKARNGNQVEVAAGTGGNIEALGQLRVTLLGRASSRFLLLDDLNQIIETLSSLSYKERVEKLELREDRADVILPASLALRVAMKALKVSEILIPGVGLKDGALLELRDFRIKGDEIRLFSCLYRPKDHELAHLSASANRRM